MSHQGLNLPPTQGTTNSGAFMPGVYTYNYTDIAAMTSQGFNALRLPINISTAHQDACLTQLRGFIDAIGGKGMLCMFESSTDHALGDGHGRGRVHQVDELGAAWARIHEAFANYDGVMYEIFNEPFGYSDPLEYLEEMQLIIGCAGLPMERCVLDGFGYAADVQVVANLGWGGALAYHFYPWWLPEGKMTQENFSNKLQLDLAGLAHRVYITEFGAALDQANACYEEYMADGTWMGGNVNCLRGFHDGLLALKKNGQAILGVYHWHGWHNGDSYDFWDEKNVNGSSKVLKILEMLGEGVGSDITLVANTEGAIALTGEPIHIFRKDEMTYLTHTGDSNFRQMSKWNWKYERLCFRAWTEPTVGAEPIFCLRKEEVALYCHRGWDKWDAVCAQGWDEEKVAFYAFAPECAAPGAVQVHEWRKGAIYYYTTREWDGWDSMTTWGWSYSRVAFCV